MHLANGTKDSLSWPGKSLVLRPLSGAPLTPPQDLREEIRSEIRTATSLKDVIRSTPEDFQQFKLLEDVASEANSEIKSVSQGQESGNELELTTKKTVVDSMTVLSDIEKFEGLRSAWLGTSVLSDAEWSERPSKNFLDQLIKNRSAAEVCVKNSPYDPDAWLTLTNVYFELCFVDLQITAAHKAILLIKLGLDHNDSGLGMKVREAVSKRLFCNFPAFLDGELNFHLIEAYKALLRGLLDGGAYWDGLKAAREALKIFPSHDALLLLQSLLKEDFQERSTLLQDSKQPPQDIRYLSRVGRMYKTQYPWLNRDLFIRTPAYLKEINMEFNSTNCEVRRAALDDGRHISEDLENVGALGVFAKRDIRKDEILLLDHNVTLISNISPTKMEHCDACHASLSEFLISLCEIRIPQCCKSVAYCSDECHDMAINGYHKVLCGKDFGWLYDFATSKNLDPTWRPLMLLRILAVVVADLQRPGRSKTHPLQHPLLARLTEGFSSKGDSAEQEWNYFSHVVAPTRILIQLGIDVFASEQWSGEVIHCIYWRIINNACRSTSITVVNGKIEKCVLTGIGPGYIFFNHSCDAGVSWTAAGGFEGFARADRGWTGNKQAAAGAPKVRIGSNALLCVANRDLKKGQEVRISYLPPGNRTQLARWFEGGCGCGACEAEDSI